MTDAPSPPVSPLAELLAHALSYPEAWEDHPWGETVVKVRRKIFVFLGRDREAGCHVTVKLPRSAPFALDMANCAPTGYGLGRAGWITATFGVGDDVPLDLLRAWIKESYQAVAPKTLVARL
ncbi:MmcQ/YjbR family DNA-binding protein [Nitrospirillum pindoramense]|uniref:Putative DNA-binding protein (MmcQ/YjbR family) n=1 Tax=Nitrospirillum amazonense TaxID=28077 RepID=A0A560GW16_9PROT|nr:MmcQ/YjbR family DNA-binding protein [Nitrospirillum amazonense]TWB38212.1 putative DNA-binding protein (MmcQ/YjbR family) [Nitrospirillum amazonense]